MGLGLGGGACSAKTMVEVGSGGRLVESGWFGGGSSTWGAGSWNTGIPGTWVGPVAAGSDRGGSTVGIDVGAFCGSVDCGGSGRGGFDG